jgi:hypothetical protein
MKVYLAAMMQNDFRKGSQTYLRLDDRERAAVDAVIHRLDSYHYIGNERLVKRIRDSGVRIFLDSGAFSAFTQGATIDLNKYCRYIKTNMDIFDVVDGIPLVSVLDAIGDADETYRNQLRMAQQGVKALPCYHFGEPVEVLQFYAKHFEYITIGGMVPISTPQLQIWLDRIWGRYLTNPDGSPKLKVHGFGLTSVPLMARYPWYSVDSSSWVQLGGMGAIFLPEHGMLHISEFSPNVKEAGKHFDTLPKPQQDAVRHTITSLGFDIERLRVGHLSRKVFNCVTYTAFGESGSHTTKRFVQPQPHLF